MSARGNARRYRYVPPAEPRVHILSVPADVDHVAFNERASRLSDLCEQNADPAIFEARRCESWPFGVPGSLANAEQDLRFGPYTNLYARLAWPLGTAWEADQNSCWSYGLLTDEDVLAPDWVLFWWLREDTRSELLASDAIDAMTKLRLAARWAEIGRATR